MDAFLEIRLLSDPEFPPNVLLNVLYGKLHQALAARSGNNIGISFPDFGKNGLGTRMRLHGMAVDLEILMAQNWMVGLRDHTEVGQVLPVGKIVGYRIVRRVQAKSNPERLRRRLTARKGITAEQAREAIPDSAAERVNFPYVVVNSRTTGQQFRLFVEHLPLQENPVEGPFSAYGLSSSGTIPWF
jgi:CRISPR-associated endonuclease Csy4